MTGSLRIASYVGELSVSVESAIDENYIDYNFGDAVWPITRARKEAKDVESATAQVEDIERVAEYCENNVDCRREQVLAYFDEQFDPAGCSGTCDNCTSDAPATLRDLTQASVKLTLLAQQLDKRATRTGLIEVFIDSLRSGATKALNLTDVTYRGAGKDIPRELVERVVEKLIRMDILSYESKKNSSGWSTDYITVVRPPLLGHVVDLTDHARETQ